MRSTSDAARGRSPARRRARRRRSTGPALAACSASAPIRSCARRASTCRSRRRAISTSCARTCAWGSASRCATPSAPTPACARSPTASPSCPGTPQVQVFATPAGTHGFGWHYDLEDVFIAQTAGMKDYYFRAQYGRGRRAVPAEGLLRLPPRDLAPDDRDPGCRRLPLHPVAVVAHGDLQGRRALDLGRPAAPWVHVSELISGACGNVPPQWRSTTCALVPGSPTSAGARRAHVCAALPRGGDQRSRCRPRSRHRSLGDPHRRAPRQRRPAHRLQGLRPPRRDPARRSRLPPARPRLDERHLRLEPAHQRRLHPARRADRDRLDAHEVRAARRVASRSSSPIPIATAR